MLHSLSGPALCIFGAYYLLVIQIVLLVVVPIMNGFFKEHLQGVHDHLFIVLQRTFKEVSNSKKFQEKPTGLFSMRKRNKHVLDPRLEHWWD